MTVCVTQVTIQSLTVIVMNLVSVLHVQCEVSRDDTANIADDNS